MSDEPKPEPHRPHYIGAPEFFLLNQACLILWEAFPDGFGTYLVGSSLKKRDYRDVDVRTILPDAAFDALFPGCMNNPWNHPLWSLMCSSISLHLSRASGLKIDYQIQRQTDANRDHPGPRNALHVGRFFYERKQRTE